MKKKLDFLELVDILNKIGHLPLPPYMNRSDEKKTKKKIIKLYLQKLWCSCCCPTASLHFTPELLEEINAKYSVNYLTLHVGAGTFKPVDVDDILNHPMHSEYFEIGIEAKKL